MAGELDTGYVQKWKVGPTETAYGMLTFEKYRDLTARGQEHSEALLTGFICKASKVSHMLIC